MSRINNQEAPNNGCVCSWGCDSCDRLAEAWKAMREALDFSIKVFGAINGWEESLVREKARAALRLAEKVRQ